MPGYQPPGYGGYQPMYQPMPYNPVISNEQRMQQILQANPQLAAQYSPQPQMPMLKGRPVSGIEEARAAQIDLDGSVHVFTDVTSGRIYTKQLGMTGATVFEIYERQPPSEPVSAPVHPPEIETLTARIEALEAQLNAIGGTINANEPNAINRNAAKQRKSDGNAPADGGQ